nr:asparagine synthase C-terminal domain-containing protein [Myxococcota bacterium]
LRRLLTPELAAELEGYDPLERHREYLDSTQCVDELSRLLYLDAKTFLPCLNLTYTDKMSMAASVEVRVPLLDDELVALAPLYVSSYLAWLEDLACLAELPDRRPPRRRT